MMAHKAAVQVAIGAEERRYYLDVPAVEVIEGVASFIDARTIHVYPTLSLGVRQAAGQVWDAVSPPALRRRLRRAR